MPSEPHSVPCIEYIASRWTIRRARSDDRQQLQTILNESPDAANWIPELGEAESEGQTRTGTALAPSTVVLVAADHAEIAGFAAARLTADEGEILNVAVRASHRAKGIASDLVGKLIADLHRHGARRVFLEVRESNESAIRLYQRLGFAPAGIRRAYYRNPDENALIFQRKLMEI
jgi:[ribosomal protein S18]-alanine N-acetyltransferase